MGIRFYCPNGHKLNVKQFQAGLRCVCPTCQAKVVVPPESTRKSSKEERTAERAAAAEPAPAMPPTPAASAPAPGTSPNGAHGSAPSPTAQAQPAVAEPVAAPQIQPSPSAAMPQPLAAPATPLAPAAPAPAASETGPDALSEAPGAVWYVRPAAGGQYGPAGAEVMRTWLAEGRVGPDALVWREGWRDWRAASDVFPQLATTFMPRGADLFVPDTPVRLPGMGSIHLSVTRRRKSRSNQIFLIVMLVAAVAVLLGVFIYVITRGT